MARTIGPRWMSVEARDLDIDGDVFAVLLIPDPCPFDIRLDGTVGSDDLAALLGAWGAPCSFNFCAGCGGGPGEQQSANALSGVVDSSLEYLLGASGQASVEALPEWFASLSQEERLALAEAIAALGEENAQ